MTGAQQKRKLKTLTGAALLFFVLPVGFSHAEPSQLVLRVNNLTCYDCHSRIYRGLQQLDENIEMQADPEKQSLIISYPDTLKHREIANVMQSLGYKVRITSPAKQGSEISHKQKGGQVTYGYCTSICGASSSTWKEFYRRYFVRSK